MRLVTGSLRDLEHDASTFTHTKTNQRRSCFECFLERDIPARGLGLELINGLHRNLNANFVDPAKRDMFDAHDPSGTTRQTDRKAKTPGRSSQPDQQ